MRAQKVMVLVDCSAMEPGALQTRLEGLHLDFHQINMGGPELTVEFLRSDFCVNPFHKVIFMPGCEGMSPFGHPTAEGSSFIKS